MHWITTLLVGMCCAGDQTTETPASLLATSIRLHDLNADGLLDRIELGTDGSVTIALNRGARQFEPIAQELPAVLVSDVLVDDLNADGMTDLYLVSSGSNVALLGDHTGRFTESTLALGLTDPGVGLGAEHVDIDADGTADVLLHNADGDVIFWGTGFGFERDPAPAWRVLPQPREGPTGRRLTPAETPSPAPAPTAVLRTENAGPRVPSGPVATSTPVPLVSIVEAPTAPTPGVELAIAGTACAKTILDATTGSCLRADSTPTLGRLYPLSTALNVDGSGDVGMGTTQPQANLHVVGDSSLGTLLVAPTAASNGSAELILAEDDDASFASFHLRYEGVSNDRFLIESHTPSLGVAERFSIGRNSGYVGIGTTGLPSSRLHVAGDTFVQGRIRSDQTSYLWYTGMSLVLNAVHLSEAAVISYLPGSDNYGQMYRTTSDGTVNTMLPLTGIPERIYGQPVRVTGLTIYFKTDSGEYIDTTAVFHGSTTILTDSTNRSATSLSSYTLTFSQTVTQDMVIRFETEHTGTGSSNAVSIPRVRVHLSY